MNDITLVEKLLYIDIVSRANTCYLDMEIL